MPGSHPPTVEEPSKESGPTYDDQKGAATGARSFLALLAGKRLRFAFQRVHRIQSGTYINPAMRRKTPKMPSHQITDAAFQQSFRMTLVLRAVALRNPGRAGGSSSILVLVSIAGGHFSVAYDLVYLEDASSERSDPLT